MKALIEYRSVAEIVNGLILRDVQFQSDPPLHEIFASHPKTIAIFSHGSPLSWLPIISAIVPIACEAGGGARLPIGIMDHVFFQIPFLRILGEWVTQSPTPLKFEDLVAHFQRQENADIVLFPEGSNCFFGDPAAEM